MNYLDASCGSEARAFALLVEHNKDLGLALKAALEDVGLKTIWVKTSDAATATLLGDHQIDLLICDYFMPGPFAGIDLAVYGSTLRKGLLTLLTSELEIGDIRLPSGIHLLAKPFTVDVFLRAVDVLRTKRRA